MIGVPDEAVGVAFVTGHHNTVERQRMNCLVGERWWREGQWLSEIRAEEDRGGDVPFDS